MLDKIKALEVIARQLEPNHEARKSMNDKVENYADAFLDDIEQVKAFVVSEDKGVGILDYALQDEGRPMDLLLDILGKHVDHPGLNPASGGHLAYIPGGGIYPSALGDYLADVFNRYAGIFFASPGAVRMENLLLRWMCGIMGYPDTALGNLTSGGSIANLIAIATARDARNISAVKIRRAVIYLTKQVHHSIQKAIRIAGLGEAIIRYLGVDDRFRMKTDALEVAIEKDLAEGLIPFLVVGSAGTTDTGAIDPLEEIARIAKAHQLWFHVDAAYGGFFILSETMKTGFAGIELSDSVTVDPHKGLFLPYGTGAVLIKDTAALGKTHVYQASYMQDVVAELSEPSPANLSPELTKHFRGLRMWLPLQLFGLKPFKAALEEKIWLTRYFYGAIQEIGFEVGPYPELSVMIYRYVPEQGSANDFNARLVEMVREDGRVFLSSTTIDGVFWLRLAVLAFRTHLSTINICLEVLGNSVNDLIRN